MSSTVKVRCVICDHVWQAPLTHQMPMCPKCMGPVVVEKVTIDNKKRPTRG